MKTFEEVWENSGFQYGEEELENVKLGWQMCLTTLQHELRGENFRLAQLKYGNLNKDRPAPMHTWDYCPPEEPMATPTTED